MLAVFTAFFLLVFVYPSEPMIRPNWLRSQLAAAVLLALFGCSGMDHSAHSAPSADGSEAAIAHTEAGHTETDHSETGHSGDSSASHSHGADGHHHHPPLVIPADQPAPAVTLVVTPDPVNGWNLELQTTNFDFAPERVNGESTFNEGHAHLLVNGEKRGRIYSNWHHLTDLPSGETTIQVTLNGNGHEEFIVDGEAVADTVTIVVP